MDAERPPAPEASSVGPLNPTSAHDIASVVLSLGALMLSLFGIIERMVTFEKLGVLNEFALLALLPGIATLGFLACARAISWMISNLQFEQWHPVVPEERWAETRRPLEQGSHFRCRLTLRAGAYLLFTVVIAALAPRAPVSPSRVPNSGLGQCRSRSLAAGSRRPSSSSKADAGRTCEDGRHADPDAGAVRR